MSTQAFQSYNCLYFSTVGDLPQDLSTSRDATGHLNHLALEVTLNLKRKLHKVQYIIAFPLIRMYLR